VGQLLQIGQTSFTVELKQTIPKLNTEVDAEADPATPEPKDEVTLHTPNADGHYCHLGVSASFLRMFARSNDISVGMPTAIASAIVAKETMAGRCPYVEVLRRDEVDEYGYPFVSWGSCMVSHAWASPFVTLVSILTNNNDNETKAETSPPKVASSKAQKN
jgi:hypothetical protein